MTRFRPCIDLHAGQVKQIIGSTLTRNAADLRTNYVSSLPPSHFARLYRDNDLTGGHIVMLGRDPANEAAAREALAAWPGGLQVAGGITDQNARSWIEAGADKVIVTSYLFPDGRFSLQRLQSILDALDGDRSKLVLDLSCRRIGNGWVVAMDRWQTLTDMQINQQNIKLIEPYCSEFLIHAADVEGMQLGIDEPLVRRLVEWCSLPVTYAGGVRGLSDLDRVKHSSRRKVDLTIGSALDIFGGNGVTFGECVEWNKTNND